MRDRKGKPEQLKHLILGESRKNGAGLLAIIFALNVHALPHLEP